MAHSFRVITIAWMWRIFILIGAVLTAAAAAAGPPYPATVAPSLPAQGSAEPGPGMFLVARRTLVDPNFSQSVVYLAEHDADGTLGLIVNRPSNYRLSDAIPDLESERSARHALNFGGPVGVSMIFMLLRSEAAAPGMAHVAGDVYISADRDVLDAALAVKKPATELRFYIGHSGWAAGQLEYELQRGSWHVVPADSDAIFSADTDSLWQNLIEQLEPEGIQVENRGAGSGLALAAEPARVN